jgi:tellurite methyltransferase
MDGGYDELYRSCPCVWGKEPGSLVRRLFEAEPHFAPRRVLDAGCGEGKNSVFYARLGASVLAIDVSDIAIEHAKVMWGRERGVEWVVGDICYYELPTSGFDLIIAYGLLHCFQDRGLIAKVISSFKTATRQLGYNIVCCFNDRRQELGAHGDFRPSLLSHRELSTFYADWHLVYASDEDLTESHPHNNLVHTHSLSRFIYRKPSAQ